MWDSLLYTTVFLHPFEKVPAESLVHENSFIFYQNEEGYMVLEQNNMVWRFENLIFLIGILLRHVIKRMFQMTR